MKLTASIILFSRHLLNKYNMRQARLGLLLLAVVNCCSLCAPAQPKKAQQAATLADKLRKRYHIPELAYAVVSADSILSYRVAGVQRTGSNCNARSNDHFHIGSNTKAITALMAAHLVQQGRLQWNTRFLELFPELKAHSQPAYDTITLQHLLSFRGLLPSYTYTFEHPTKAEVQGADGQQQRLWLAGYFLAQQPMHPDKEGLTPSNADYILAGLMLERASGKAYKQLVSDWAQQQGVAIAFGYPNNRDTMQPWGHNAQLQPVPPGDHYKLDWLLSAGNININVRDYARILQVFLRGLRQDTDGLPAAAYKHLVFGLPYFSLGWFHERDAKTGHRKAWNEGNAGAFISQVYIAPESGRAYVLLCNAATEEAGQGMDELAEGLMKLYGE
jgi:CubicO group peptidase (beta-lactamase class C family)